MFEIAVIWIIRLCRMVDKANLNNKIHLIICSKLSRLRSAIVYTPKNYASCRAHLFSIGFASLVFNIRGYRSLDM